MKALLHRFRPLIWLAVILMFWQAVIVVFGVADRWVVGPFEAIEELLSPRGTILRHSLATSQAAILGYLAGLAFGVPIGILINQWAIAQRVVLPLLAAADTLPKVAIAPLLVIVLGFGIVPRALMAFSIALFPIVLGTVIGLQSVPHDLLRLARSTGARWWQGLWIFELPAALPAILAGAKLSIALAVTGAIVGEFVAPREGLGYLLVTFVYQYDARQMSAVILMVVALSVLPYLALDALERRVLHWHPAVRSAGS